MNNIINFDSTCKQKEQRSSLSHYLNIKGGGKSRGKSIKGTRAAEFLVKSGMEIVPSTKQFLDIIGKIGEGSETGRIKRTVSDIAHYAGRSSRTFYRHKKSIEKGVVVRSTKLKGGFNDVSTYIPHKKFKDCCRGNYLAQRHNMIGFASLQKSLVHSARDILVLFSEHVREGEIHLSHQEIASLNGISKRTVRSSIKSLIEHDYIQEINSIKLKDKRYKCYSFSGELTEYNYFKESVPDVARMNKVEVMQVAYEEARDVKMVVNSQVKSLGNFVTRDLGENVTQDNNYIKNIGGSINIDSKKKSPPPLFSFPTDILQERWTKQSLIKTSQKDKNTTNMTAEYEQFLLEAYFKQFEELVRRFNLTKQEFTSIINDYCHGPFGHFPPFVSKLVKSATAIYHEKKSRDDEILFQQKRDGTKKQLDNLAQKMRTGLGVQGSHDQNFEEHERAFKKWREENPTASPLSFTKYKSGKTQLT